MFTYQLSSLIENQKFLADYVAGISIPYDDFLEEYILNSDIYTVHHNGEPIGFFGKQAALLTIFFIQRTSFRWAKAAFADIKQQFVIEQAFVPTTDLGFLSVMLEDFARVEIQALHFTETDAIVRSPEFSRDQLRLATEADVEAVEQLAGDFLDRYAERIRDQHIYVLEDKGELLGLGVLVPNQIMRDCIGTGMFTREDRRGAGIGRSIILHLRTIAHELGKTPVPGCWYYNTNSRKTLESAGYITQSKLLRFYFGEDQIREVIRERS
ncbi:MAG TPA: GNAT family N-acetyltransferase [Anaerolineae bacterium]|nr:GNAT family N-acetyltransferase [Anaerolineae bacterium]